MKEVRSQESEFPAFLFIFCFLSVIFFLFPLYSCGRKGEPTLKSYEKPPASSGLTAVHRESDIMLFWNFPGDKEKNIKGFFVMKTTDTDFNRVAFLENDKRSYTDRDFFTGLTYRYKIVSQNLRDILSDDSNVIEVEPKGPPAPPARLKYKIKNNTLTLTWKSAGKDVVYNIYKSKISGHYTLTPINKDPITDTSFRDTLITKQPVYYTIRSLWGGVVRDEGPASQELEINPQVLNFRLYYHLNNSHIS
jgi:hypothetical protein